MTIESVLDLAYQLMAISMWILLPVVGLSMAVGLIVSILQAATSIQEASLTFVPKLIGMGLAVLLFGAYILEKLVSFTITMFNQMSTVVIK